MAVKELKNSKTQEIKAEALFEAGAHFGHQVKRWNPKMAKFLWGKKSGIHIFDLEKTAGMIEEASKALTEFAAEGKRICLVGTKRQAREVVGTVAKELGIAYVTERWLGGIITNWRQIKTRLDKLADLKKKREAGALKKYTKKEQILFDRQIARLEKFLGGLTGLNNPPEVLVVVDTHKERSVIREANNRGVKVIGIVDSNGNPDPIDFVIPMNDDSIAAIEIVIRKLGKAIELGVAKKSD